MGWGWGWGRGNNWAEGRQRLPGLSREAGRDLLGSPERLSLGVGDTGSSLKMLAAASGPQNPIWLRSCREAGEGPGVQGLGSGMQVLPTALLTSFPSCREPSGVDGAVTGSSLETDLQSSGR